MKAIERMGESFGAKVLFQCLLTAINNETQSAGIGRSPQGRCSKWSGLWRKQCLFFFLYRVHANPIPGRRMAPHSFWGTLLCPLTCPLSTVQVESISPRDLNPDPKARSNYWQMVWSCREARYRATYRPVK